MIERYSLGLILGLSHGEEDAIEQDGGHHHIVKVLIGGDENAGAPD